jgi:hypothetical protein
MSSWELLERNNLDHDDISNIVVSEEYDETGIVCVFELEWEQKDRDYALITREIKDEEPVKKAFEIFDLSVIEDSHVDDLILVKRGNDVLRQTFNVSR